MCGSGVSGALPSGPELKGGVLTFFPSYNMMEAAVTRWKSTGLFDRLKSYMCEIVVEPRGSSGGANVSQSNGRKQDFNPSNDVKGSGKGTVGSTMKSKESAAISSFGFTSSSSSSGKLASDEDAVASGVVAEFESALRIHGKCLLLAVCRWV